MRLAAVAVAVAAVLSGCGSDAAPRADRPAPGTPSKTPPPTFPVAYLMPRDGLARLAEGDARQVVRGERVVASAAYETYPVIVLMDWLDGHGISLRVPPALRPTLQRVFDAQDLTILVLAREHRRDAAELRLLHPTEQELRRHYARFSEHDWSEGGKAMLDWLRVLRQSMDAVDDEHVVVIPVTD